MNVHYHPGKSNVVDDALSRMSMESTAHNKDGKKELVKDIHSLARLGVRLVESTNGGVLVNHSYESSLVVEVKDSKHLTLVDDNILRYQDKLYVPDVDDLRTNIIVEAHGSKYSIHPCSIMMYHDLKQIYLWNSMKKYIVEYVAKFLYCQHVKSKHLKPGGLTQIIEVLTW